MITCTVRQSVRPAANSAATAGSRASSASAWATTCWAPIGDMFIVADTSAVVRAKPVINANPALQERELIKMASLATAIAETLRRRGVAEPAASLTAEAGIAVFRVAFERWISDPPGQDLRHLVRDSLDELRALTTSG